MEEVKKQLNMASKLVDDLEGDGFDIDLSCLLDSLARLGLVLAPISGEHNLSSLAYFASLGIDVKELLARG